SKRDWSSDVCSSDLGFYRVERGKWYAGNFEVPDDPPAQLKRAMNKLLKLQYIHRLNFDIEGKVVFPHIDFRLNFDNQDVRERLRSEECRVGNRWEIE